MIAPIAKLVLIYTRKMSTEKRLQYVERGFRMLNNLLHMIHLANADK